MTRGITKFLALALLTLAALTSAALAQTHPVEGAYTVTAVGNEIGTVNFTLTLKRSGESWTGEVTESPVPLMVKSVTVDASNKVTIDASTGDTPVTIIGTLEGNQIKGEWTAGDSRGTWTAMRKEAAAPGAATVASAGTSSASAPAELEGTYDAEVTADGQGTLPFTLIIKKVEDKLATEVENAGDLNIVGIEVNGEVVTLKATFQGNPFDLPGKLVPGKMEGKWEAGGFSGSWMAKKKN